MDGAQRIAAERQRQIDAEGWTPEHDDGWVRGELAAAAGAYERFARYQTVGQTDTVQRLTTTPAVGWPWHSDWWKPSADPVRNLEKAGALIAAEIDRIERERGRSA